MTTVSVLIACHGDQAWADLAWSRAWPSVVGADECLVVYRHDATLAEIRNDAVREAEGEFVVILDADDELDAGYLAALRAHLAVDQSPLQLLVPQVAYVEDGKRLPPRYMPHGQNDLREGNWMVIGTAVHRDVFHQAGGFRELPIYEDYDLWIRCVQAGAVPVKVPGMVYVAHVTRHSRNKALPLRERLRVQREIVAANYGP